MNTSVDGWEYDYKHYGEDMLLEFQYGLGPA